MAGWHVVVVAMGSDGQHTIRGPSYRDRERAEAELQAIREAQKHQLTGGSNEILLDIPWLNNHA